jgi:predicted ribosome quality control (RQC) complex YloA/Tae2 family protein
MCDYFGAPVGPQAYGARKAHIQDQLANASDRIQRKLAALERQARQAEEIEQLRKKGELLFAYAATLSPRQTSFEAQYDPDDLPLVIPLDPNLTGVENARRYFDRYEKAKRANADVPAPQAAARQELAYLDQLRTDLELAERWPEIEAVRDALQSGGYWRGPRVRSPKGSQPAIQRLHIDSFAILVGRSAAHNQKLITENAAGSDLWLHARGVPGGHVLIRNDGRSIPEIVIEAAAGFAAYYSAARAESLVEVDVTQRRYVRPIKGGKPGMVTYKNERTLKVVPRRPAPSK